MPCAFGPRSGHVNRVRLERGSRAARRQVFAHLARRGAVDQRLRRRRVSRRRRALPWQWAWPPRDAGSTTWRRAARLRPAAPAAAGRACCRLPQRAAAAALLGRSDLAWRPARLPAWRYRAWRRRAGPLSAQAAALSVAPKRRSRQTFPQGGRPRDAASLQRDRCHSTGELPRSPPPIRFDCQACSARRWPCAERTAAPRDRRASQ